jgi:hypothetical protein
MGTSRTSNKRELKTSRLVRYKIQRKTAKGAWEDVAVRLDGKLQIFTTVKQADYFFDQMTHLLVAPKPGTRRYGSGRVMKVVTTQKQIRVFHG